MIPIEQEPDRVPRGLLRAGAAAVALGIAASIGATLLLGRSWLGEDAALAPSPPARLDTRLFRRETESEALQREAADRMRRYGWADRARGLVDVPLEVAIERYLAERAP